ncbi:hypothetical protein GCM10022280_09630 [Sphingomonas swuensis]|uniref:Uncharacterized protein n=1 Tax=Sphingomonas swuensis TaxID=977800 RepID=A0ABP7SMM6_9SPHN
MHRAPIDEDGRPKLRGGRAGIPVIVPGPQGERLGPMRENRALVEEDAIVRRSGSNAA